MGRDKDGLMEGEQHNTTNRILWTEQHDGSFYLGALLAGAKMATAVGDMEAAAGYYDFMKRDERSSTSAWNGNIISEVRAGHGEEIPIREGCSRPTPRPMAGHGGGLGRYLPQTGSGPLFVRF